MSLPPLGTVLALLLACPRRDLEGAISTLPGSSNRGSSHKALEFLLQHIKSEGGIDRVCVLLVENVVSCKRAGDRRNSLILLRWLYGLEEFGASLAGALSRVLSSESDNSIKFGACLAVRELLQDSASMSFPKFGTFLCEFSELARKSSVVDKEKKRPTNLAVASAECALAIIQQLVAALDLDKEDGSGDCFWQQLDAVIALLYELYEWKRWTQVLYARGLLQVIKIFQDLQKLPQGERELGSTVLHACWKDFGKFLVVHHADCGFDIREFLLASEHLWDKGSSRMRCHVLACFALALGGMDPERLVLSLSMLESELSELLVAQMGRIDADCVDLAADIAKLLFTSTSSCMPTLGPLLLNLLNNPSSKMRESVCDLLAEYLILNESGGMGDLFKGLESKDPVRRENAMNVLVRISASTHDSAFRNLLGLELLRRLEDRELLSRIPPASYLTALDPQVVLPKLTDFVYTSEAAASSAVSEALLYVLQEHENQLEAVNIFFDSLRDLSASKQKPCVGLVQIMRLISLWASSVKEWDRLLPSLMSRMFSNPSNVIYPKIMSQISEHLANMSHIVFPQVLKAMQEDDSAADKDAAARLFRRLSPLLVLNVLPMGAYNCLHSEELYGNGSISHLLAERMCEPSEYSEVRKLSAELVGRLLPQNAMPIVMRRLQSSIASRDLMAIKSCIYATCNSLMARGFEALKQTRQFRALLVELLLWPPSTADVHKLQHACIDCFAIMIYAEQCSKGSSDGSQDSVLANVLDCLTNFSSSSPFSDSSNNPDAAMRFRVCMANVLISASSKISESSHQLFTSKTFPVILGLPSTEKEPLIRAACIQVLFNLVHNLKAADLADYAKPLLDVSLTALTTSQGLLEEREAGAKLLAALLVKDSVLTQIESHLLDVPQFLSNVLRTTGSSELRRLCEQLLSCISM